MERGQVWVALHLLDIVLTQDNLVVERRFVVLVSVYFVVHIVCKLSVIVSLFCHSFIQPINGYVLPRADSFDEKNRLF